MKLNKKIVFPVVFAMMGSVGGSAYAKDEKVEVDLVKNNWVHYDTEKVVVEGSLVTPVGFFGIEVGKEEGKSKIFPELSIGGFGKVSQNPWLSYDAKQWALKYGLEKELNSGLKFTAGAGVGSYHGENDDDISGSKDISTKIWSVMGKVENDDYKVSLNYKNKLFEPTQLHPLAISPVPLEQRTRTQEHFVDVSAQLPYLNVETNWISGDKKDEYSMLILENNASFSGGEVGVFPRLNFKDKSVAVGPIFTFGSQEGSINELDYSRVLVGVGAEYSQGKYLAGLRYVNTKSDSFDSNLQFSLDEKIERDKFEFELNKYNDSDRKNLDWNLSVSYLDEEHEGRFSFSDPMLAYVTQGINHLNKKSTKSLEANFTKQFDSYNVGASLKTIDVSGDFYGIDDSLDESGTEIVLSVGRKF